MDMLIFCPEKGFYTTTGDWVDDPNDASRYDLITGSDETCDGENLKLVDPEHFSLESFDAIVDRLVKSLGSDLDGFSIATKATELLDQEVTYLEDSGWEREGDLVTWEDLSGSIREALSELDRNDLAYHYNEYCESQVYLDQNEGFIHQQVL